MVNQHTTVDLKDTFRSDACKNLESESNAKQSKVHCKATSMSPIPVKEVFKIP